MLVAQEPEPDELEKDLVLLGLVGIQVCLVWLPAVQRCVASQPNPENGHVSN
jgi:hypothetical protein